ncbi:MAG: hypothetical protein ACFCVF_07405 [Kineosporiaceae bacterium]
MAPAPRPSRGEPPGRSAGASPERPPRGRSWLVGLVPGLLVGLAVGGTAGALVLPGERAPGVGDARVAELQVEETARDSAALDALNDRAARMLDLLAPVVTAAGRHVLEPAPDPAPDPGADGAGAPAGAAGPPMPGSADVAAWGDTVGEAREVLGDPPSAGTGVNVARAGLAAALVDLEAAVDALALAADTAEAGGDPVPAQRVAGTALRGAAATWSVGATQLDAVNVEAGNGHVHLYLPPVAGSGALAADPAPTGRPAATGGPAAGS